MAIGTYILQVMASEDGEILAEKIHSAGFGVTRVAGKGFVAPVTLLSTVIKRKHVDHVLAVIHETIPDAFVTIEELRSIEKGIFRNMRLKINSCSWGGNQSGQDQRNLCKGILWLPIYSSIC